MAKLLKDRYFWYTVALAASMGIVLYIEIADLSWFIFAEGWELTHTAVERLLLLGTIAIATWRFGFKGGLIVWLVLELMLFSHAVVEAYPLDSFLELGIVGIVGIIFSWLLGSYVEDKRLLKQSAEDFQQQAGKLSQELTQRQRAEAKLKQTVAKLEHSNAELQQFAYVASHDLQEPLRMVSSFTQLLARRYQGKLDKDADEFIAYAVDGASRMQRMINDLLTYSRVGTRGKELQPTDGEAVFEQAVANLQMAIEETGATVTHNSLPTVLADESQLVQLFQNLLGNAIKFHGQEPPRVHISAEQKGKEWVFSVGDNGIGIDQQHLERVFIIFQRLHAQTEYPGTGIGLAICIKIVERHGGRIWVESEPGKGSIFYFTMPAKGSNKP